MGFMDSLGETMGRMAAMGEELQRYKSEYESLTNADLAREYRSLRSQNMPNKTTKNRLIALKSVMSDRGLINNQ